MNKQTIEIVVEVTPQQLNRIKVYLNKTKIPFRVVVVSDDDDPTIEQKYN